MTGPNDYDIGGYGYMTKVSHNGSLYCFSDVFDFAKNPSNRFSRFFVPLPVQGDSGSWLIYNDGMKRYFFGVVIAVEKSRGVGIFASSIFDFSRNGGWKRDMKVL
jgi:hypothetical protein